jgi:hypothetical protein
VDEPVLREVISFVRYCENEKLTILIVTPGCCASKTLAAYCIHSFAGSLKVTSVSVTGVVVADVIKDELDALGVIVVLLCVSAIAAPTTAIITTITTTANTTLLIAFDISRWRKRCFK